jgi:hypothetical protein
LVRTISHGRALVLGQSLDMKGTTRHDADRLTRRHTAFDGFEALINARGGYRPSIRTESAGACTLQGGEQITSRQRRQELLRLADIYDNAQQARGDNRRAFRS